MASPNSTYTEIVTTTLERRRRELADNVLNHNALLRRLNQRGNISLEPGGRTLVEELEYAENQTFKYYSGYEALDIQASDTFSAAEYNWKQAAVVVTISGLEARQNMGREQMIRLLDRRMRNAEKTLMNNISTGVFSDGSGSSGKQVNGLQLYVGDDPTSGTVGGINKANFSFWNNQEYDFSDNSETASSTTIQGAMNSLWLDTVRGMDHIDLFVADSTYYSFFKESLQTIQRITSEESGAAGFSNLKFYGVGGSADVVYDDACPATRMYGLNTDFLHWRVHRDANFAPLARRESVNQDATVVPVIFMGNLTLSNMARQGVIQP